MADMEEIETAVGDDEGPFLFAEARAPGGQGVPRDDFIAKIHKVQIVAEDNRGWQAKRHKKRTKTIGLLNRNTHGCNGFRNDENGKAVVNHNA